MYKYLLYILIHKDSDIAERFNNLGLMQKFAEKMKQSFYAWKLTTIPFNILKLHVVMGISKSS